MKKKFLIITVLLTCINLFAQSEVNQYDDNGKRHGVWKGTYQNSGNPRYQGTFEHGKEKGIFKFFNNDKKSAVIATRDFTKGDGVSYTIFYDVDGKKLSEGKEVDRLREGEWKFYHPGKDAIMSVEYYSKGKLTGVRKVFFPEGAIAEEAQYQNGVKHGTYKKYTEEGIVLQELVYKEGKMHGAATYRNSKGEIVSKGNYTDNVKSGIWMYYEKGKVVKKETDEDRKVEIVRQRG